MMANINLIRKQIELILEQSFGTQYVEKCSTETYPNRYKLVLTPLIESVTKTQKRMLLNLPNVITYRTTDSRIYIMFDCHPKLIKL